MELVAEYVGEDGQQRRLQVPCAADADNADALEGLLTGVARMKELVTELLGPPGPREAHDQPAAGDDEASDGKLPQPGWKSVCSELNSIQPGLKQSQSPSCKSETHK
ncbi:EKC/KEOPS complex subunit GON7 isoform X1 [Ochotona princeps]|uniref:EKC/KEOPS complex subunit GON7 isoform X1 n=1 Tax=Ochotona princeps TaxID=9978 RepID=UPI0027153548|nr:EKC/KEOPS complex subunit GON7 isoform X1 [Ochotona princeps]